jgi:hypothetical protein
MHPLDDVTAPDDFWEPMSVEDDRPTPVNPLGSNELHARTATLSASLPDLRATASAAALAFVSNRSDPAAEQAAADATADLAAVESEIALLQSAAVAAQQREEEQAEAAANAKLEAAYQRVERDWEEAFERANAAREKLCTAQEVLETERGCLDYFERQWQEQAETVEKLEKKVADLDWLDDQRWERVAELEEKLADTPRSAAELEQRRKEATDAEFRRLEAETDAELRRTFAEQAAVEERARQNEMVAVGTEYWAVAPYAPATPVRNISPHGHTVRRADLDAWNDEQARLAKLHADNKRRAEEAHERFERENSKSAMAALQRRLDRKQGLADPVPSPMAAMSEDDLRALVEEKRQAMLDRVKEEV